VGVPRRVRGRPRLGPSPDAPGGAARLGQDGHRPGDRASPGRAHASALSHPDHPEPVAEQAVAVRRAQPRRARPHLPVAVPDRRSRRHAVHRGAAPVGRRACAGHRRHRRGGRSRGLRLDRRGGCAPRPRPGPHRRGVQAQRRPRPVSGADGHRAALAHGAGADRRAARGRRTLRRARRVPPPGVHVGRADEGGAGRALARPRAGPDRHQPQRAHRRAGLPLPGAAGRGGLLHPHPGGGARGLPRPLPGACAAVHSSEVRARVAGPAPRPLRRSPRVLRRRPRRPRAPGPRRVAAHAHRRAKDRGRRPALVARVCKAPAHAGRGGAALAEPHRSPAARRRAPRRAVPRADHPRRLDRAAGRLRHPLPAPRRERRGRPSTRRAAGGAGRPRLHAHPPGHSSLGRRGGPRAAQLRRQADGHLRRPVHRVRRPRSRPARRGAVRLRATAAPARGLAAGADRRRPRTARRNRRPTTA